jgi:predicted nucleic acid-binding protein
VVDFVVDNSIAVAWAYPQQATDYTEDLLDRASSGLLHTAFIWPAEFANVTGVLVNRGVLSEALGENMIDFSHSLGLIVGKAPDISALYSVSRKYRLSAYDAAYLELSIRLNLPLATRDKDLKKAAETLDLYLS